MFNSKQKTTMQGVSKKTSVNSFVATARKESAKTLSGNSALKYSTTGDEFVDQFGKLGEYKPPRSFTDVATDCIKLWEVNPRLFIMFTLFIRMITRVTSIFSFVNVRTQTVQRGAGLRHEGIMRMIWLQIFHPESFWKNIGLFISVGSWKDIIYMMQYDYMFNTFKGRVLNWDKLTNLLLSGLEDENHCDLIKKYLPQIKANSKCTTIEAEADTAVAKYICSKLFGKKDIDTYKKYRKLKSSGTAHTWQQLISQRKFDRIDFNTIHGRALHLLVKGKFLSNQNLEERYEEWIESKPIAKFTGYVTDLFMNIERIRKGYQIDTLNKQFYSLVETAKKNAKTSTSMIVVRDTSGSMGAPASGINMSAGNVAKSLALFFSYMLPDGIFSNSWIEFNRDARLHNWTGSNPYDKFISDHTSYIGNTNFQSVIDLFCTIKNKGVSESEFPTGIICISDGEFDPSELDKTNVERALEKLYNAKFSPSYIEDFKIVLWNVRSRAYGNNAGNKFETYGNVKNVFYFSGYDGSIVAFLTGVEHKEHIPSNAEELFSAAMDQEILNMVEV